MAAESDLLFGLLALQVGLIDQGRLVAAFQAWARDKGRDLADHLVERGDLDPDQRLVVEALAAVHLKSHGGDPARSLAAVPADPSTRDGLASVGDPGLDAAASLIPDGSTRIGPAPSCDDRTTSFILAGPAAEPRRFRVLRPHARGGLGAVYVALDAELNREVALKEILDRHADDLASRQRFLIEAEITGGLEHPGIVPVYGLGHYDDGRPYYAMRFIRGDSLKDAIARFHGDDRHRHDPGARALALRQLLRRFVDVCNAIDYAHGRGVLHRDIKPANIIVGRHGETLVVDWGLAKATGQADPSAGERTLLPSSASGSAQTLPGSAMGTPSYMSPEQAAGDLDRLGPATDVYSLGATLYSLLTGVPPFDGDVFAILKDVQLGEFPAPRRRDPTIDPALEAICLKAMARGPDGRYESCRALADDIERWTADEPVSAWREPIARRARRWARRHRTAVVGAAASLLAGVIGLGVVLAVQARANGRLREANERTALALRETTGAKAATESALARSEASRRQAEAVRAFLVEAFRSPDPSIDGRNLKVVDLLDRASARAESDFAGEPTTRGALLDALGETFYGLGLIDRSSAAFAKALAAREAALGPDHPDTLVTRNNLAATYQAMGRGPEALPLFEAVRRGLERRLGPDDPETLTAANNLALAYQFAGRLDEALPLLESTLKGREARLGADHPETLNSFNNLAAAYEAAGRVAEAVTLHESTRRRMEATLGPDHPMTLTAGNNLALAYRSAGRLLEAVKLHEATLRARERVLGPDHHDSLTDRHNLAAAYLEMRRMPEAAALFEAATRGREASLGPRHPETVKSRLGLAMAHEEIGMDGVDRRDWTGAERAFRRSLAIRAAEVPDDWSVFRTRSWLGEALTGQGRLAEAEPLVLAGLEGMKARAASIPEKDRDGCIGDAADRIVTLYEAWGKPDRAASWRLKLGLARLPDDVFAKP